MIFTLKRTLIWTTNLCLNSKRIFSPEITMPNNTYKSAAVPFINNKGERSMKKVKVERYVAGKKPAYANEDEDEYYTTDEEISDEDEADQKSGDEEEYDDDDDDSDEKQKPRTSSCLSPSNVVGKSDESKSGTKTEKQDECDDDDPRFRRLRELESLTNQNRYIEKKSTKEDKRNINERNIVFEEEDEDEIRRRHAIARTRVLEEPIGPQVILGELADQQLDSNLQSHDHGDTHRSKRIETDDLLEGLVLTGLRPAQKAPVVEEDVVKAEERFKDMIEHAKEEAIFTAQIHKKIEEDNKRELEKEALEKGGIGNYDMEAVKTDDEDDEIAYEEWKVREIQRILRDKSERARETAAAR